MREWGEWTYKELLTKRKASEPPVQAPFEAVTYVSDNSKSTVFVQSLLV